jgi:hypothetical protein
MKASGKKGSNGVLVSENAKKRFQTDIYINTHKVWLKRNETGNAVHEPTRLYGKHPAILNSSRTGRVALM